MRTLQLAGAWGPPLLLMAVIFHESSYPSRIQGVDLFTGADKVFHGVAYSVLGFLLYRAFDTGSPWAGRALPLALLVGAAYGLSDEVHQLWIPLRTFQWGDLAADAAGSWGGAACAAWVARRGRGAQSSA